MTLRAIPKFKTPTRFVRAPRQVSTWRDFLQRLSRGFFKADSPLRPWALGEAHRGCPLPLSPRSVSCSGTSFDVPNGAVLSEASNVIVSERIMSPPAAVNDECILITAGREEDVHPPDPIPIAVRKGDRLPAIETPRHGNVCRVKERQNERDSLTSAIGLNRTELNTARDIFMSNVTADEESDEQAKRGNDC